MANAQSENMLPRVAGNSHFNIPKPMVDRYAVLTPEMQFNEAAEIWLAALRTGDGEGPRVHGRIRSKTDQSYRQYVRSLRLVFGQMRLRDIRLDHFRRYEDARLNGDGPFIRKRRPNKNVEAAPCPAGPKKVNQEISILKRILRVAGLWREEYWLLHSPLSEDQAEIPRALSRDEQRRWLKIAASAEKWHLVYWYSELAFSTCMSTNEIRSLRICDINLETGIVTIPWAGSKNRYRHRTIPIGTAEEGNVPFQAILWLLERANRLGAREPGHYLFPFRRPPMPFDPTKPMSVSGLKRLWDDVRLASGLKWFRQYDARHTAITRYAEEGIPIATIMKMAGHISPRMTEHYTHISEGLALQASRRVRQSMFGESGFASAESRVATTPQLTPSKPKPSTPTRCKLPTVVSPVAAEPANPRVQNLEETLIANRFQSYGTSSYFFTPQFGRNS